MTKLLLSLSALLLLAALVFTGIYFTRFQSMAALQKITDYSDGYNLYCMDIRYRYSLNDLLARGITDDQSMVMPSWKRRCRCCRSLSRHPPSAAPPLP